MNIREFYEPWGQEGLARRGTVRKYVSKYSTGSLFCTELPSWTYSLGSTLSREDLTLGSSFSKY